MIEVAHMDEATKPMLEKIVFGASKLFIKKGYRNTSVRDIASYCGISTGAIYHYVKSKEDILNLFREYTKKELILRKEQVNSDIDKLSATEALKYILDLYIDSVERNQDIVIFWVRDSVNLNDEQLKLLCEQEEYLGRAFEEVLERGCESGEFEINNIHLTAHTIISMCDNWALKRWLFRKKMTLSTFKKNQIRMILEGISGKAK